MFNTSQSLKWTEYVAPVMTENMRWMMAAHCKRQENCTEGSKESRKPNEWPPTTVPSTNVPPPIVYGLRKDHKDVREEQKSTEPPVRPVCNAREAHTSGLINFLCRAINNIADTVEGIREVRSSKEMRATFEKFNVNTKKETRMKCKLIQMDGKAHHPSMKKTKCVTALKDMIYKIWVRNGEVEL